ncbi:hypothetical protein, partial [Tolypothrix sp. VBCCA 56010]|uniref:hypothetical protein n=1 Tax=Tolypothrix sp. VBCCA 56010 TaxID=3137731 RepID=UPI003D7F1393
DFFGNNYFNSIIKDNALEAGWKTRRFPTAPRNLLGLFHDENQIIGLRFVGMTCILVIDLDKLSAYNPHIDPAEYNRLCGVLEDIGLVDRVLVQSSYSTGKHIFIALPNPVPSHMAAQCLTVVLQKAGFRITKGQLEIFPNRKGWSEDSIINYHGLRLPLQPDSGSFVLDPFDFTPVHNDLNAFIGELQHSAARQDMETFKRVMKEAYEGFKVENNGYVRSIYANNVAGWYEDLVTRLTPGWTGHGQTNDLIPEAVKLFFVFNRLDGEELIQQTAAFMRKLPGYELYCRHQHELEQRVKDWLKSIKNLGYYHYDGTFRPRAGVNYGDTVALHCAALGQREDGRCHNKANESRKQTGRDKLAQVTRLIRQNVRQGLITVPQTIRERLNLIIATAKQHFGQGFSIQFLYTCKGLLQKLWRFMARTSPEPSAPIAQVEPEPLDTLQTVITPEETLKPALEQALPAVSEDVTLIENLETQSQSGVTGIPDNNEGWGVSTPPAQAAVDEHLVVESVKPVVPVVFSYPPDFPSFIKVGEKVKFQSLVTTGWRKGTIVKINFMQGYFLNCVVQFYIRQRNGEWVSRIAEIYNDNWIKPLGYSPDNPSPG